PERIADAPEKEASICSALSFLALEDLAEALSRLGAEARPAERQWQGGGIWRRHLHNSAYYGFAGGDPGVYGAGVRQPSGGGAESRCKPINGVADAEAAAPVLGPRPCQVSHVHAETGKRHNRTDSDRSRARLGRNRC